MPWSFQRGVIIRNAWASFDLRLNSVKNLSKLSLPPADNLHCSFFLVFKWAHFMYEWRYLFINLEDCIGQKWSKILVNCLWAWAFTYGHVLKYRISTLQAYNIGKCGMNFLCLISHWSQEGWEGSNELWTIITFVTGFLEGGSVCNWIINLFNFFGDGCTHGVLLCFILLLPSHRVQ